MIEPGALATIQALQTPRPRLDDRLGGPVGRGGVNPMSSASMVLVVLPLAIVVVSVTANRRHPAAVLQPAYLTGFRGEGGHDVVWVSPHDS